MISHEEDLIEGKGLSGELAGPKEYEKGWGGIAQPTDYAKFSERAYDRMTLLTIVLMVCLTVGLTVLGALDIWRDRYTYTTKLAYELAKVGK